MKKNIQFQNLKEKVTNIISFNMDEIYYLSTNDLRYAECFKKAFDYLDSQDFVEVIDAIDVVSIYSVIQYSDDRDLLNENAQSIIDTRQNKIKSAKEELSKYFLHLKHDQFIEDIKLLWEKREKLSKSYIDAFTKFGKLDNLSSDSIEFILNEKLVPIEYILENKIVCDEHISIIKKFILELENGIELLTTEYDEKDSDIKREKYYLPKFSESEINELISNYLNWKYCDFNVLRLLIYHKNLKDSYIISPTSKIAIKKKHKELEDELIKNHLISMRSDNIFINPEQEEFKKYDKKGQYYSISFSRKWIKENTDYPTLLNNLIYMFELVDDNFRFNDLETKHKIHALSKILEAKNKDEYGNNSFEQMDGLTNVKFYAYFCYLKNLGIKMEDLFDWFSSEYINTEFGIEGFSIKTSIKEENIKIKCKNLFSEIDGILKSFMIFQKYGSVDPDLYEEETLPNYRNLLSLNKKKYYERNYNSNVFTNILNLLFSNQSLIHYIDKDKNANSFFELITKQIINYKDFKNHQKFHVDFLLEKEIIIKDSEENIHVKNNVEIVLLKQFYDVSFLDLNHLSEKQIKICEKYAKEKYVTVSNTLFSTAEANYLNYYLNNSSYTNALALRNKYEHPKKLIINSQELISDYIKGLKILSLIIIKINDELCIKYPETRKN